MARAKPRKSGKVDPIFKVSSVVSRWQARNVLRKIPMIQKWLVPAICVFAVGACTDAANQASSSNDRPASAELARLAAPGQDLSRIKIDPSNGCYLYRYRGPIETTYLPVRTANGNPICTRAQS